MDAKEESTYGPATDKSPAMIVIVNRRGAPKNPVAQGNVSLSTSSKKLLDV